MKGKTLLFLIASIILMNISCNEDDVEVDCVTADVAYVNEVEAPETAKVNETIPVSVTFSMNNTCGSFMQFQESTIEDNENTIEVIASYFGCVCGQRIVEDTQVYEFTAENTGTYDLNFRSSSTEFITVTIEVTQ